MVIRTRKRGAPPSDVAVDAALGGAQTRDLGKSSRVRQTSHQTELSDCIVGPSQLRVGVDMVVVNFAHAHVDQECWRNGPIDT